MVLLDASEVQSENDLHGNAKTKPGKYHVAVLSAEETASKKKGSPGIECEFVVLCEGITADNKPTVGQKNSTIKMFLNLSGSDAEKTQTCLRNATLLALATGIMKPGERKEPDWSEAVGRELIINVKASSYKSASNEDMIGSDVAMFGYWSLGNEQVADVPKDVTSPGMIELAKSGKQPPTAPQTAKISTPPAPLPPTANLPPQSTNKFASLL